MVTPRYGYCVTMEMIVSIDCVATESTILMVWHFAVLNFICHMSDHFLGLFRSSWRTTELAGF